MSKTDQPVKTWTRENLEAFFVGIILGRWLTEHPVYGVTIMNDCPCILAPGSKRDMTDIRSTAELKRLLKELEDEERKEQR